MKEENLNNLENSEYKAVEFNQKHSTGFLKNALIPFTCGILGAGLVIGCCFFVPNIKNALISNNSNNSLINYSDSNGTTEYISLTNYSDTAVNVANKVLPSIVGIKVEYTINTVFNQSSSASAEGSGIIISEDGYILTNNHIVNTSSTSSYYQVDEASKIIVNLYNDDTDYPAKIIGTDSQTDLAVIKIEKSGLTKAELGNSDSIKVGEFAMAIGSPLGLQSSVTAGLISAVNRDVTDSDGKTYHLIQTDAAINSGNSGGALVNSQGQVIGINTLKLSGSGIEGMGFAIPINSTIDIYNQLIQYNKVKRPYIGISGIDVTEDLANKNNLDVGIYVRSVDDFSAAQKAGIENGDIIIEADGTSVKTMNELNEIKNKHNIGDKMTLKLIRSGKEKSITLVLQEQ